MIRVLEDLSKFCRAHESTFNPNSHVASKLDGRREVWLHICNHINLSEEDLYQLYSKSLKGD